MIVAPDMASSAVRFFERVAGRALEPAAAGALARVKLSPEEVRRLTSAATPLTAEQTRREMAKHTRSSLRGTWGRGGLPGHVVRAMYAEYQAGRSCTAVATIFGGTRQSVFEVFKSHGFALRTRELRPKIVYGGRAYTFHKGYFRATEGDRKPLHHRKWEDAHGPIPPGWQVTFRDANPRHLSLENLHCAPIAEVTLFHHARHLTVKAREEDAA